MYPFWEVPLITSGLIIALIASFHILPSHLATGAFWFNVYIEREAIRKNRPELFEFLKKFTLLILIFSFVIGSITGVGIWYSATVASPRGISGLIHNYVWGWATEWVFFILEIATIYVYYYTLGRIDKESHLKIGLTYALAAWISMIIITGILAFMLTSGKWSETGGFFDGFFNETYWPQLLVRTSMMFGIAGLYAVIAASRMKNDEVGKEIIRKASIWGIVGMVFGAIFSLWYLQKLPEDAKEMAFHGGLPYLKTLLYVAGTSYMIVLLLIGTELPAKRVQNEVERYQEQGLIKNIYWAGGLNLEEPKDRIKAGRILTLYVCGNCHSLEVNGIIRPLPVLLSRLDPESPDDIADFMDALGDYPYMPPFPGNDEDKALIGEFLFTLPKGGM